MGTRERRLRRTSTVSGPTSTLPYPIHAGAKPTNVCSARTSDGRPSNGTATASSSPISMGGSRTSGCSSKKSPPHFSPRSGRARPSAAISSRPKISAAALTISGSRAGGPNVVATYTPLETTHHGAPQSMSGRRCRRVPRGNRADGCGCRYLPSYPSAGRNFSMSREKSLPNMITFCSYIANAPWRWR